MTKPINAVILDNDECLGYFGTLSGLYISILGNHFFKNKLSRDNINRQKAEALFRKFSVDMLKAGFARPGLKEFFKLLKFMKKKDIIQKVIMYTSASRNAGSHEREYVNWVGMLRDIFEEFVGNQRGMPKVYDYDHSGRSDEHPQRRSSDGATLKSVGLALKLSGIHDISNLGSVFFLDDRPHNIFCEEDCDDSKVVRLGVSPYFYLPELEKLQAICNKYDSKFAELGLDMPSKYIGDYFKEDRDDLESEGYKVGGKRVDNDGLGLDELMVMIGSFPQS